MADLLTEFLREAAAVPFKYGEWDCAMFLANWVRAKTGVDPATDLRGRYRSKFGWMRIVRQEGELDALVGRLALAAGMRPTEEPGPGAVAVIKTADIGLAGAIKVNRGFAVKLTGGLAVGPAQPVAAWSF